MRKLNEAGLIVNANSKAYPKQDQILILAGGAGSGKGFVVENILLFEGKTFNVDDLKEKFHRYAKKFPNSSIAQKFYKQFGYELKDLDFKKPRNVYDLHMFIKRYGIVDAEKAMFFKAVQHTPIKPNVIFDVTLDEPEKTADICYYAAMGKYDPKNINIVWILNDIEIAKEQNLTRPRTIPEDILVSTHVGAAMTMKDIMDNSKKYQKYIDGDIWIVFNKPGVDTKIVAKQQENPFTGKLRKGIEVKKYIALHLKEKGKPALKFEDILPDMQTKIFKYIPAKAKKMYKN